jgi:siroheme synthase-like protein
VVIGGGKVALRKIKTLLECGADITVISPSLDPELTELVEAKGIDHISREYEPEDTKDVFIVFAATGVKEINSKVAMNANKQRMLVNVVDSPEESDFIIPSLIRRGDLILAVSTSGRSPALAKKIRTRLEQVFGEEYGLLLSMIKDIREEFKKQGVGISAESWQKALDLDLLLDLLKRGKREKARSFLLKELKSH